MPRVGRNFAWGNYIISTRVSILISSATRTQYRLSSDVLVEEWADLVSAHVAPRVTLDATHVAHLNAKWLVKDLLAVLHVPATANHNSPLQETCPLQQAASQAQIHTYTNPTHWYLRFTRRIILPLPFKLELRLTVFFLRTTMAILRQQFKRHNALQIAHFKQKSAAAILYTINLSNYLLFCKSNSSSGRQQRDIQQIKQTLIITSLEATYNSQLTPIGN